jgi:hypothetical protein
MSFALMSALMVACGPSEEQREVAEEMNRFAKAYRECSDKEDIVCDLSADGRTFSIKMSTIEPTFLLEFTIATLSLDLPEDITMRVEHYRPIQGVQEWSYRHVDMLFSLNRSNCSSVACDISMEMLLKIKD